MGFGSEVGWTSRSEQLFEDGTNLYQKPTPKQDKKNATERIFEPPQCADYSRETRVNYLNYQP